MRTTLNIEENLLQRASYLLGIHEKTALVKLGLKALIEKESSKPRNWTFAIDKYRQTTGFRT